MLIADENKKHIIQYIHLILSESKINVSILYQILVLINFKFQLD